MNARAATGLYAAGETHMTLLPPWYFPPGSKRGVVSCHGSTGTGVSFASGIKANDTGLGALNRAVADAGLPVICADLGGTQTWGNDTARTRVGDAWTELQARPGVATDKVLLLAASMGSLNALNYARANPTKVAAIALVIPIVDLADAHDNRGFASVIETAYGGAAAYTSALPTHNPMTDTATVEGIPIRLWYSDNDPSAVPERVTTFDAAITSATSASMGTASQQSGHSIENLDPAVVVSFLAGYA